MNIVSMRGGKLTINVREFNIDCYKILAGHDRETGKRYYIKEVETWTELPKFYTSNEERIKQVKSIFWIK